MTKKASKKIKPEKKPLRARPAAPPTGVVILRYEQVSAKIGLCRSEIKSRVKTDADFPKPVPLGKRAKGFLRSEIDDWIEQQVEKRA